MYIYKCASPRCGGPRSSPNLGDDVVNQGSSCGAGTRWRSPEVAKKVRTPLPISAATTIGKEEMKGETIKEDSVLGMLREVGSDCRRCQRH